ncbi:MAG: CpaF family protein [Rhodospirillales bacterium]|nr:CpaF family protein [Rhodospirillales bacterium]
MFGRRQLARQTAVNLYEVPKDDTLSDWAPVSEFSSRAQKEVADNEKIERTVILATPLITSRIDTLEGATSDRAELAVAIRQIVQEVAADHDIVLEKRDYRDAVTVLLNDFLRIADHRHPELKAAVQTDIIAATTSSESVTDAKNRIQPILMERIDVGKASALPRAELADQISEIVGEILVEERMHLNQLEQRDLITSLLNDMLGLGPLEPLLADEKVTDIMVNGPEQVFVERGGKLELSDVHFVDNAHVMNIATRIVTQVGRRIDESSPLVDARLMDGSRVNIIIPPLAIDGPTISIRKFAKQKITLDVMEKQRNMSPAMATVLKIASRCRLNILISGGTGSGKTTLLNAMSRMIDHGERIVTIEDAAELQLQQPHVVRLETRPPNLEGGGEISQRELVKNTLRMRPDRIILGEIRAGEALDMLQAMNTGHDGSMCTIHANRPREALTRLENMVAMAGVKLPNEAVRSQIAGAVNLVVQIARMRDGVRRITHISEVVGMEGEVVTMQDLFTFQYEGEDSDGKLFGAFQPTGMRPHFLPRAQYFGLERALMEAVSSAAAGTGQ